MKSRRESEIQREVLLAASRAGARLFRNNSGVGWVGTILEHKADYIVLGSPRPLHAGLGIGSSDLIGWTPRVIMGRPIAVFTAIEVKAKRGRATLEQLNFLEQIEGAGGIARIVRSAEELDRIF